MKPADRSPIRIVDCTLRDGGYYNDWDYSSDLVNKYLASMQRAGIDMLEIGFRTVHAEKFLGPTAFSTDEYLDSLTIGPGCSIAVMMNAKELVSAPDPVALVNDMFRPASDSQVDMVRIAAVHSEIPQLHASVEALQGLGYQVAVNLMQISNRTTDEIVAFGSTLRDWNVDVAYIADSFGGLRPPDVAPLIESLIEGFQGPVGCHLHDNMTYALSSTLAAVDAGATWVDGTLLGMGRGPGNVRTEYLALELVRLGRSHVDVIPLVELVARQMTDLQREYGWGSNLYYFLSAMYGVHPTYIMELTKDGRYGAEEIVAALEALRSEGGGQFKRDRLTDVTSDRKVAYAGTHAAGGWCAGQDVLIVGPGPSARDKRADIESFIRRVRPTVIGLNGHPPIAAELIDVVAVCHPTRAAMDAHALDALDKPVFAPQAMLDELGVKVGNVRDVGVDVADGFGLDSTSVRIPRLLVAAYALALAAAGGASRIMLVGFDGFAADDSRQAEMFEVFERYQQLEGAPPVLALTRTSYPIEHSSLYARV